MTHEPSGRTTGVRLGPRLVPALLTRDLPATRRFYEALGFTCCGAYPDAVQPTWMELRRDDAVLQFHTEPACGTPEEPGCSGTFYVHTRGVRALAEAWRNTVPFAWGPEVMDYGLLEFGIQDPNGYYLAFAEASDDAPPAAAERLAPAAAHVSLEAAVAAGPPPGGELAVPILAHGTLQVEMYMPRGEDRQKPHARDEVYVVARGSGRFFDGERRHDVAPGSFLFVPAGRPHRFEDFSDDFAVWVMFYGPPGGEADTEHALDT